MWVGNVHRRRRGVVNIWVILFLFLIVGLVGWACDSGWSTLVLNQLQAAAAPLHVETNTGNNASGDIVVFGANTVELSASAIAQGVSSAAIIVLHPNSVLYLVN